MAAVAGEAGAEKYLAEAFRRFCRSIELCDDYLRGYYGLKLVCAVNHVTTFGQKVGTMPSSMVVT